MKLKYLALLVTLCPKAFCMQDTLQRLNQSRDKLLYKQQTNMSELRKMITDCMSTTGSSFEQSSALLQHRQQATLSNLKKLSTRLNEQVILEKDNLDFIQRAQQVLQRQKKAIKELYALTSYVSQRIFLQDYQLPAIRQEPAEGSSDLASKKRLKEQVRQLSAAWDNYCANTNKPIPKSTILTLSSIPQNDLNNLSYSYIQARKWADAYRKDRYIIQF